VDALVAAAREGLREWFTDLRNDPTLLDEGHWMHALAARWSEEDAPVTDDTSQTPRIELRGNAPDALFGMVFAGVPVQFGEKYVSRRLQDLFDKGECSGLPTGRLCYDVVVPGLSKHLVLNYLLRTGSVARGSTVALADSPAGNDVGLTQYHTDGMPFVSVAAKANKCPEHLRSCHVGGNDEGSGAVVAHLVDVNRDGVSRENMITVQAVEDIAAAVRKELGVTLPPSASPLSPSASASSSSK
jgi:hypothetical protein